MPHLHSVYDTDSHFTIDPITLDISNQSTGKTKLMKGDHNSERFTFEIPRLIDGHDMTLCNRVEVHYINIDAATKITSKGVYKAEDIQISPDSDDIVIFSWLIEKKATQYAGTLNFRIAFKCINEEDEITLDYARHTEIFKGIAISDGIDNGEAVVEEYNDILAAWEDEFLADINTALADVQERVFVIEGNVEQQSDSIVEFEERISNNERTLDEVRECTINHDTRINALESKYDCSLHCAASAISRKIQ